MFQPVTLKRTVEACTLKQSLLGLANSEEGALELIGVAIHSEHNCPRSPDLRKQYALDGVGVPAIHSGLVKPNQISPIVQPYGTMAAGNHYHPGKLPKQTLDHHVHAITLM